MVEEFVASHCSEIVHNNLVRAKNKGECNNCMKPCCYKMYKSLLEKSYHKVSHEMKEILVHELKTPLIPVFSGVDYLMHRYRDEMDGDIREIMEIVNRGAKKLKLIIDGILDSIPGDEEIFLG
ncbi:MAG: hypothetical protein ACFFCS_15925 [Candidatus Hodarchaeota archaeon]